MIWTSNNEVQTTAEKYDIKILEANCDPSKAQNKQLPTNSYLVTYLDMNPGASQYSQHYDIVTGKRVDIFDCYYERVLPFPLLSLMLPRQEALRELIQKVRQ